jgi:hypothetical protein
MATPLSEVIELFESAICELGGGRQGSVGICRPVRVP